MIKVTKFQMNSANKPLPRPGVYRITELRSGKIYIGISVNVQTRCNGHVAPSAKNSGKLANAIKKHGADKFLFEPIYYCLSSITDTSFLSQLEADKIAEYDSVKSGYNIIEACGRVGPYGAEFANKITESHAAKTPEERSRMGKKSAATTLARYGAAAVSEMRRQGVMSQGSEVLAQRMRDLRAKQTPEQRHEIAVIAGRASAKAITPERAAARNAAFTKERESTTLQQHQARFERGPLSKLSKAQLSLNGTKGATAANASMGAEKRSENARLRSNAVHQSRTPEERVHFAKIAGTAGGAAYAAKPFAERSANAQRGAATRKANGTNTTPTKGSLWINNGVMRKRLYAGDPLPDGWVVGWHLCQST